MLEIFLKTLPFFLVIGTGWAAGKTRFFPAEATAWLTKFVFYFALSAMLFRFAATLDIDKLFHPHFVLAYLTGSLAIWALAFAVAKWRRLPLDQAAMEAHVAMTGNTGFLGVPMLVVLLGEGGDRPGADGADHRSCGVFDAGHAVDHRGATGADHAVHADSAGAWHCRQSDDRVDGGGADLGQAAYPHARALG